MGLPSSGGTVGVITGVITAMGGVTVGGTAVNVSVGVRVRVTVGVGVVGTGMAMKLRVSLAVPSGVVTRTVMSWLFMSGATVES